MVTALPPEVDGPITLASKEVFVDNVLPQSLVTVYADGVNVGHATSTDPGWIVVPLIATLAAKQKVTATQNYQGGDPSIPVTSGESDFSAPVEVQPVPKPLPPLAFVSGLSSCMDSVLMGGLIPGTQVDIHVGSPAGPLVVSGAPSQPTGVPPIQWFGLAAIPVPAGSTLYAQQRLGKDKSPMTPSVPVAGPPVTLGWPVEIITPVRPCQMALGLAKLTPGANISVTNNATVIASATVPWPAYTLAPLPPFKAGTISVAQYFARCYQVPAAGPKSVPVMDAPLPTPSVGYPLCADVKQLSVSNLLAGEVLIVQRVVQTSSTTHTTSVIGAQGVSKETATVFLPKSFQPTDPGGPVSLWIEVSLCGATAPSPVVVPVAAVASYPAPTVPPPLYACARSVLVHGAHPGSVIQIFSGSAPVPRSNPVVATTPDLVVGLWTPLVAGESIFAKQTGCGADGVSKPSVGVLGLPSSLPTPHIYNPVRPGATSVLVTNVYPGAQVYLMVNGVLRTAADATGTSIPMPTGTPLGNQDKLQAFQTLCTEKSGTDTVEVTIGILNVVISPPGFALVRGKTSALTVTANDVAYTPLLWVTGLKAMVSVDFTTAGKPTGPSVSGITGTILDYTPGVADGSAVAFVFGAPGYEDAHMEIPLTDPLKVWVGKVETNYAIIYGSGFAGPSQVVTVEGEGFVKTASFTGDIVAGIKVTISCTGTPGQYWNFTVQSTSGGPTLSGKINCPL